MILRHDSLPAYLDHLKDHQLYRDHGFGGYSWDNGVNGKEAVSRATNGDPTIVNTMTTILDKITPSDANGSRSAYVPSIAGSRVSVPDYLAGSPTCMRRRTRVESSQRHVSIYVDGTCSAMISADTMIARGATILGFLTALQQLQIGVDLYFVCSTHAREDGDLYQVIQLDTRPLDLSTSGFVITHPGFIRNVCYGVANTYGFNGGWPRSYTDLSPIKYADHMSRVLDLSPSDVYIPACHVSDEIVKHPEQWIEQRIMQVVS